MARSMEQLRLRYELLCNALERENTSENWNASRLRDEIRRAEDRLRRVPGGPAALRQVNADYKKATNVKNNVLFRRKREVCREFEVSCDVSGYLTFYLTTSDPAWTETRLQFALQRGTARMDLDSKAIVEARSGRKIGSIGVITDDVSYDGWQVEDQGE